MSQIEAGGNHASASQCRAILLETQYFLFFGFRNAHEGNWTICTDVFRRGCTWPNPDNVSCTMASKFSCESSGFHDIMGAYMFRYWSSSTGEGLRSVFYFTRLLFFLFLKRGPSCMAITKLSS